MATNPVVKCDDCGMPYSEFGADMTLPHDQWDMIEGDFVLCANCIVKRASKLPRMIAVRARIEFAGD